MEGLIRGKDMLYMKITGHDAKFANLTGIKFELYISNEDHFSDIFFTFRASLNEYLGDFASFKPIGNL
jgi:hypothetical protein